VKKDSVLVVAADTDERNQLGRLLRGAGHRPVTVNTVEQGLVAVGQTSFLFTILDSNLPDIDSLDFLRGLGIRGGTPGPVIILADPNDSARAATGLSLGASDLVQKPYHPEDLESTIKESLSRPPRTWPAAASGTGLTSDDPPAKVREEMALWRSPKMRELSEIVQQAAQADVTVLICGETGAGKDVVARAVHYLSDRHSAPFVKVNCAAVPRELLESELFGHERGAFTGAHQLKIGKFEAANRGTIFLDEIGDLHPALQAKLLHVLQDGSFSRVGGKATLKVDVRVIAATNRDLERAVLAGGFRDDLYYRLNVIQIVVPPLRERIEDIPPLVEYFVRRYTRLFNREGFTLAPAGLDRLLRHRYPGNVRELENVVKRMIVLSDPHLEKISFPVGPSATNGSGTAAPSPSPTTVSLKDIARRAARAAEREAIAKVLEQTAWNRVKAARILKISYRALLYKIKYVGLDRASGPSQPTV